MRIENPTLAHFRHFIRRGGFSPLFTNLPAYKAADIYVPIRHYICREPSTNQPFLCKTNPILSAVGGLQMNVSSIITKYYENKSNWTLGENKPNSNPIKPNLKRAKMNANDFITKDYRKKDDFAVRKNKPNSNPISVKPKMNINAFSQKDYENEPPSGPKKTNPNKANFNTKKLAKSKIADIIISLNEFFGDFLCVKIAVAAKLTPKKLWKKRSRTQSRPFGRVCKATAAMLSWSQ